MPAGWSLWLLYPTPRRAKRAPALEPPTQTMFARGPVGGGHSGATMFRHALPCHSRLVHPTNTFVFAWIPGTGMTS